ncbi:hypothetical protein MOMA_01640 [Moraxella macacae 0408225]|uniref:PepSY domain-containing protein n=1 Tax=Moraxella macacae 0408225 TaxID=1230338 RepID=L2F8K8_9GAMM|nr:PepSY domain-containing protein [Moraxella macacae]ELA09071.1 hypothetical protein MOMA_01640 [Moraxella macacae 0408225]
MLKTFNKKIALVALLALPFGIAYADLNDRHDSMDDQIETQIYQDKNFNTIKQKAIEMLQQKGYRVADIDADDYRGKPSLSIEAYKNGQEYDIEMLYPSLKIVKEKIDR